MPSGLLLTLSRLMEDRSGPRIVEEARFEFGLPFELILWRSSDSEAGLRGVDVVAPTNNHC